MLLRSIKIFFVLNLFLVTFANIFPGEVELKWNFKDNVIAYKVTYYDESKNRDITLLKDIIGKEGSIISYPKKMSMTVLLKKVQNNEIEVGFFLDPVSQAKKNSNNNNENEIDMRELIKGQEGKLVIRGRLDQRGDITSYWLRSSQKNLLALLFELPTKAIKIDDTWKLEISLIALDPNFIYQSGNRINQVLLKEIIKNEQGDNIAICEYKIREKLIGKSSVGDIDWKMYFDGVGRFNIDKGQWESMRFINTNKMQGGISADKTQLITIEPISTIPIELLQKL